MKKHDYSEEEEMLILNLVDVEAATDEFIIEMRYATEDNFVGKKVYPLDVCIMQKDTLEKLMKSNKEFLEIGLRIKIWDAYRPISIQKIFFDLVPNESFVANPYKDQCSVHNSGFAVDLTLVDMDGKEIEMPTSFDDFSEKASRNSTKMSVEAVKNLSILTQILTKNGFKTIDSEWWHYNDADAKGFVALDISFDEILKRI
ncbi:MAG: M15 family metallopeptidase [Acholeplasma sp.]|nr:M15 family metallopeptidase [Acholeplasma sp.]